MADRTGLKQAPRSALKPQSRASETDYSGPDCDLWDKVLSSFFFSTHSEMVTSVPQALLTLHLDSSLMSVSGACFRYPVIPSPRPIVFLLSYSGDESLLEGFAFCGVGSVFTGRERVGHIPTHWILSAQQLEWRPSSGGLAAPAISLHICQGLRRGIRVDNFLPNPGHFGSGLFPSVPSSG